MSASTIPSVGADLLAEAMLIILDLPEPVTREGRHAALHCLLLARPRTVASDRTVIALDARIEALCRMHRSQAFRALVDIHQSRAMSAAVRFAAVATVARRGDVHEFEFGHFIGLLLAKLPATGTA